MNAYAGTSVSVSKSQEAIRNILRRYGASQSAFAESYDKDGGSNIGVEFVYDETLVRLTAKVAALDEDELARRVKAARSKRPEQLRSEMTEGEAQRLWRVLHWAIKVRMEAIEEGLETFEQAFLAHLVEPTTGLTLWDRVGQAIEAGALRRDGGGLMELAN